MGGKGPKRSRDERLANRQRHQLPVSPLPDLRPLPRRCESPTRDFPSANRSLPLHNPAPSVCAGSGRNNGRSRQGKPLTCQDKSRVPGEAQMYRILTKLPVLTIHWSPEIVPERRTLSLKRQGDVLTLWKIRCPPMKKP